MNGWEKRKLLIQQMSITAKFLLNVAQWYTSSILEVLILGCILAFMMSVVPTTLPATTLSPSLAPFSCALIMVLYTMTLVCSELLKLFRIVMAWLTFEVGVFHDFLWEASRLQELTNEDM